MADVTRFVSGPPNTNETAPAAGQEKLRPDETPPDQARGLRVLAARREITERRRITLRLRQALSSGGFILHYQPQVQLASGAVHKAEAMIRLQHKRRGLILPSQFMPVAARSDIIHDIGGWIIAQTCQEVARWPENIAAAISLSLRQVQNASLVKFLVEALAHSGIAPSRLELELTEAMLIEDNEDTMFTLKALRGLGINMAIANFGLGYASLSALKRLPLSTLKLDRSLIRNIGEDAETDAILRVAIEAGHVLGCIVLADGVETEAQAAALQKIGCDQGQGAYFGQPMPAGEFRKRIG